MHYENKSKLLRAQKYAKDNGKEGDEAAIKARYLELGGLITGEDEETEDEKPKRTKKAKEGDED